MIDPICLITAAIVRNIDDQMIITGNFAVEIAKNFPIFLDVLIAEAVDFDVSNFVRG
ncbi:hypothetical protein D3C76_1677800 [compost metagenome]